MRMDSARVEAVQAVIVGDPAWSFNQANQLATHRLLEVVQAVIVGDPAWSLNQPTQLVNHYANKHFTNWNLFG